MKKKKTSNASPSRMALRAGGERRTPNIEFGKLILGLLIAVLCPLSSVLAADNVLDRDLYQLGAGNGNKNGNWAASEFGSGSGLYGQRIILVDTSNNAITSFGGGPSTIADGADVAEGAKADAAASSSTSSSSVIALLKGLFSNTATLVKSRSAAAADINAPAANTAAVVTYAAAGAGVSHCISGVAWSYGGTPVGGNLKIEDGSGTIVFTADITGSGPGFIPFPSPKKGAATTAMIVTLATGGAAVSGKVSVLSHWTE